MRRSLSHWALLLAALGLAAGCKGEVAASEDGGNAGQPDGGMDAAAVLADGGAFDATTEAGLIDSSSPIDAGSPADTGPPNACRAAGGSCVAEDAGTCATGLVGGTAYSCGGAGLECCLPRGTPPTCNAIGTKSEGWYEPSGKLVCFAQCAAAAVTCEAIGSRSEGWYATPATAACPPGVPRLVQWTDCSP